MTKIKICGLRSLADIAIANELKPDYIGFVFASKSKRYLTPAQAKHLKSHLSDGILAVGVFVNAPLEEIRALASSDVIDIIQLHGQEDEAYLAALRRLTKKPVLQAFRIERMADIEKAAASSADFVLLDNGPGGTGQRFDWSLAEKLDRPFFLAGGLDGQNVSQAIRQARPYAVDTSSGVEENSCKDHEKAKQFISAARGQ